MGIQFSHPWLLLLLVPLTFYGYWLWRKTPRLRGVRKHAAAALRFSILLLLILSLAGTQWFLLSERKSIVFAADRSDSIKADSRIQEWVRQAAASRSEEDQTGVISFGLEAALEKPVDSRELTGFTFASKTNPQFTNLAGALQLSSAILPRDTENRVVLITDGEENTGDALRQGKLLKDMGIPVDILALPSKESKDAALEAIRVPEILYQAEAYSIEVILRATAAGAAELRVYEDRQEITQQQVMLEKGENRFAIQTLAREPGLHRYRAEIYMSGDEQAANNVAYSISRVQGPAKVLIVEGQPGISKNIESVLQSALIPFDVTAPELLSDDFMTYTEYESILLNNVSATRISNKQMEMIEQAVLDYGIGLVMFGGEDSFGLGGYFKTPVERALPVYMDLRGKREIPSLGLVLVIDKSGSMEGEKIQLAQEAASRSVDLMREKDTLGVLGFDSSPVWFVEPRKLTDREEIIKKINSIPADGGTEIYTAVEQAYEKLAGVDARRKHIILLTDGQSAAAQSYQTLTEGMQKNNITMSTVAIGTDADQALLKQLADQAKGRFYAAVDQSTIPAIFSREAVLISRTYIVNQPFVPAFTQGADWIELFAGGLPKLNGYIAATPKETAEVNVSSPEPDPVLARWQYGAGRSVAWTSDVTGKWSSEWVSWSGFPRFLTQMIKWTFPQFHASPLQLTSHLEGDEVVLDVKSSDARFQGDLQAVITDESLQTKEVFFTAAAPGEYSARLPVEQPGVYMARTDVLKPGADGEKGAIVGSVTSGFVIPYSPEYRIEGDDGLAKLEQVAKLTGGRMLSFERPEEAFAFPAHAKKQLTDLSPYLLLLTLILFLMDIAVRRISIPWTSLMSRVTVLSGKRRTVKEPSVPLDDRFERLLQRKEQTGNRIGRSERQSAEGISETAARAARKTAFGFQSQAQPSEALSSPAAELKEESGARSSSQDQKDAMSRLLAAKRRTRK